LPRLWYNWFTDVSGVQLRDGADWVDRVELPFWVWDVGTDSGDTYLARNEDMHRSKAFAS